MKQFTFRSWLGYLPTKLLLLLLLFLAAESALLFWHNRQLRSRHGGGSETNLKVGEGLGGLEGIDLGGSPRRLDFAGPGTFVFVYSSRCPACAKNFDNWRDIETAVGPGRAVYVSMDEPSEVSRSFAERRGIGDRVLFFADRGERQKLKVTSVPQTIYLSGGEVKANRVGVLSPDEVSSLKTFD